MPFNNLNKQRQQTAKANNGKEIYVKGAKQEISKKLTMINKIRLTLNSPMGRLTYGDMFFGMTEYLKVGWLSNEATKEQRQLISNKQEWLSFLFEKGEHKILLELIRLVYKKVNELVKTDEEILSLLNKLDGELSGYLIDPTKGETEESYQRKITKEEMEEFYKNSRKQQGE